LLLLLISWGSHPKFCFERVTLICPSQILLKHWALPQKSSSPWPPFILDKKCGTIGNILGNTLGTWWEPHCEHAIKGFKKFENYSLDLEQEGFPLKKIKPRPKKVFYKSRTTQHSLLWAHDYCLAFLLVSYDTI
jgi:hypothetical protein